ncbi:hypothetical protein B0A52_07181 [Exophiala mesophila]|uniref:Beta-hexosaminidase n=1 Tax=Exophiala mesophila TaxID=212818 RepID=A0A438N0F9_EXOME|nr:hypothetical protein B0A52_07181 [Exophiala mesophila]
MVSAATNGLLWPEPSEGSLGEQVVWLDPRTVDIVFPWSDSQVVQPETVTGQGHGIGRWLMQHPYELVHDLLKKVRIVATHLKSPPTPSKTPPIPSERPKVSENAILESAVGDMLESLTYSGLIPWKFHPRHSDFEPEPDYCDPKRPISAIHVVLPSSPSQSEFQADDFFHGDESYTLKVNESVVVVQSNSTLGAIRGLQTLEQLFYKHSRSRLSYTPHAPVIIHDQPVWKHRGISIDIARNPFVPGDLIRTIDIMSSVKLNRLHVHATDSQAWPLDIPSLPQLAQKGAYRSDLVWTAQELEEIQAHGASKGVSVFVEIDVPGHTASVAHAFPDLIAAFNELDWDTFAAEPLSGQLKLNSSAVTDFMSKVLKDLLPRTRRFTSWYHLGGDEVNRPAYELDETVRSGKMDVLRPLLQRFIDHIIGLSEHFGFQPIVWEEMLLDWNLTLPSAGNGSSNGTLIQVWRNSQRIEEVLKRGHRVIFGDYGHWYLDCGFGNFINPYPSGKSPPGVPFNTSGGRDSRIKQPYLDYCQPYHNWRHMYVYNPVANISDDLLGGIEGGEVLMWSEQTDSYDLDFKLWPRAAAAAEVLWSGVRNESMLEDATRRLSAWRERIVSAGVAISPVQMTWCLMEGGCNL